MSELVLTFDSKEDSLSVRRFSVHEEISTLYCAAVWARSPDCDIDFETIVGRPASLTILNGNKLDRFGSRTIAGICNHMEQVQGETSGLSTYYLTIVPRLWFLTQRTNHRLFQHASVPAIVGKMLAEWRIEHRFELRDEYPELELRVQYGESDYAFLSRLLEEAGISYVFVEDPDKGVILVLTDAPGSRERRPGGPIPFVDNPSRAVEREFVTRVRVAQEVRPGRVTLRDYDFRRNPVYALYGKQGAGHALEDMLEQYRYSPGGFLVEMDRGAIRRAMDATVPVPGNLDQLGGPAADAISAAVSEAGAMLGKLASGLGVVEVVAGLAGDDRGMARMSERTGQTRAERQLEAARATRKSVTFETNVADLPPGAVISVGDHGRSDMDAENALLIIGFSLEGDRDADWSMSAKAVFAAVPYRPALRTPRPSIQGMQSAVVTGPLGEEIHTDELGRVRVQFHWDREGKHDDNSSCWMRVSQGWAGSGYGMIALPRVGQEVLVSFLEGNPDMPMVVGRLFTGIARPPYPLPADKTKSGWRSSSSPGGGGFNEILFEDKKGQELFSMQAERDMETVVKRDERAAIGRERHTQVTTVDETRVGERHTLSVGPPGSLTFTEITEKKIQLSTGEASITLEGPNITLEAKGRIFLHSTAGDVELVGGPWVKINCGPEDDHEDHELTFVDPFGNPMVHSFLQGRVKTEGEDDELHEQYTSRVKRLAPGKKAEVELYRVDPDEDEDGGLC